MFERSVTVFRLAGIPIRIDASWVIVAVLVTWSLAVGFFPVYAPEVASYLPMAVAGALGLFLSIIFHEMAHALVGRRHGVAVRSITLFVFGGVAEMRNEPARPRDEFWMAIAGPIGSVILACAFTVLFLGAGPFGWPAAVTGVLFWLAWSNTLLAGFNLLPAFPLDGGRVLRAALWHAKGSLRKATRITARLGAAFGAVLIALGVLAFLGADLIAAAWWFLLGLWLRRAAQMSYQQVLLRRLLEGERVRDFMKTDVVAVAPALPLTELVEDYIYRHHHKLFPVVEDGRLSGCVRLEDVKQFPREDWPGLRAEDLLRPCAEVSVEPGADMLGALQRMRATGNGRLLVIENGTLRGIVSLRDVMRYLGLKLELEGDDELAETREREGERESAVH